MRELLPFVVVGIATGSIYAIAATGLVLTYKTSGVFNFAHGAVAAIGAYAFYAARNQAGLPWPVAAFVAVGVVAPAVGIALERLARELASVRPTMRVVATVGLLLAVQGAASFLYGTTTRPFPGFLPDGRFTVAGVAVGYDQVIVAAIAVAAVAALGLMFRRTQLGLAMRGVVDDPTLLALSGYRAVAVRRRAWMIGSAFAAVSGILIAPSLGLDATLLTLLVIQAFGSAALGRFSSVNLAYVGAIVVGVTAAIAQRYVGGHTQLLGLSASIPFLLLFGVLCLSRPAPNVTSTTTTNRALRRVRPPAVSMAMAIAAVVAAVAVPSLVGARLSLFITWLAMGIVFLSLTLLVNTSGQISLCHAAFVAFGATTFHHFAVGAGLPWAVALLAAGVATLPVGVLVALPAVRLSGIHLALATFGFGLLMQKLAFGLGAMFGEQGYRTIPRPILGNHAATDREYYFIVLAIAVVIAAGVWACSRARLGRLLRAMSDSPVALASFGTSVTITKLLAFGLSAGIAGLAGGVLGATTGVVQSSSGFGPLESLTWLVVVAVCGRSLIPAAFAAAAFLTVAPAYAPAGFSDLQNLLFGAVAIVVAVSPTLDLEGRLRRAADRVEGLGAGGPALARLDDQGWRSPVAGRSEEISTAGAP